MLLDFTTIKTDLFNICKQIRSNPDSTYIPIIIITTESGIDDRIKGLEAGVDDFLTKLHKFRSHTTKHAIKVTLSVGMAEYTGGSVKKIITVSDKALYQAKSIGRNKVIYHKE